MSIHVNDAGTLREITEAYVNDNGTLRELESIEVNDAGTLRSFPFNTAVVVGSFTVSSWNDSGISYRSYVHASYGTLSTPNNAPLINITGFDKISFINSQQTSNYYGTPTSDWQLQIEVEWSSHPVPFGDPHPIDHFKIIGVFENSQNAQTLSVPAGYGTSNKYFGGNTSLLTMPAAFVVGNTYTIEAFYS